MAHNCKAHAKQLHIYTWNPYFLQSDFMKRKRNITNFSFQNEQEFEEGSYGESGHLKDLSLDEDSDAVDAPRVAQWVDDYDNGGSDESEDSSAEASSSRLVRARVTPLC